MRSSYNRKFIRRAILVVVAIGGILMVASWIADRYHDGQNANDCYKLVDDEIKDNLLNPGDRFEAYTACVQCGPDELKDMGDKGARCRSWMHRLGVM